MTITCELYQDSGAVVSSHGTTRISVDNIGWKSSGLDETYSYVYYPIRRPTTDPFTYSYMQYTYAKISGTYVKGRAPRFTISGNINGSPPSGYVGTTGVRLYYKLTSTYAEPTNTWDGTLIFIPSGSTITLYPKINTAGPEAAGGYVFPLAANTTYYTQYLVTQLAVEGGAGYGNIGALTIAFHVDEYDTTDI